MERDFDSRLIDYSNEYRAEEYKEESRNEAERTPVTD